MTFPSHFPQYISNIKDVSDRTQWQRKYLDSYDREYQQISSNWYGLKAAMAGAILGSTTLFCTIMAGAKLEQTSLKVATVLTIATLGTVATVCSVIFYAVLADENSRKLSHLSLNFPMLFEIHFNESMLQAQAKDDILSV